MYQQFVEHLNRTQYEGRPVVGSLTGDYLYHQCLFRHLFAPQRHSFEHSGGLTRVEFSIETLLAYLLDELHETPELLDDAVNAVRERQTKAKAHPNAPRPVRPPGSVRELDRYLSQRLGRLTAAFAGMFTYRLLHKRFGTDYKVPEYTVGIVGKYSVEATRKKLAKLGISLENLTLLPLAGVAYHRAHSGDRDGAWFYGEDGKYTHVFEVKEGEFYQLHDLALAPPGAEYRHDIFLLYRQRKLKQLLA